MRDWIATIESRHARCHRLGEQPEHAGTHEAGRQWCQGAPGALAAFSGVPTCGVTLLSCGHTAKQALSMRRHSAGPAGAGGRPREGARAGGRAGGHPRRAARRRVRAVQHRCLRPGARARRAGGAVRAAQAPRRAGGAVPRRRALRDAPRCQRGRVPGGGRRCGGVPGRGGARRSAPGQRRRVWPGPLLAWVRGRHLKSMA